jgi:imidazolonepropionase-like amidohydrolase
MRKQIFCLVVLLPFFATNAPAQQTPPAGQVSVIRAGKLIDVEAGRVQTNQMILVRGGKIEAIGENLAVPAGAAVIDL